MELKISEIQALTPIVITNYEELERQLTEKVDTYKNLVYSEENIKQAKNDRASLNKLSKAIGDERKRIKNLLLEPFTDFETKCKKLETIIDEASKNIDVQIKAFEEKEDNIKMQEIVSYFVTVVGEFSELLDFDIIFNERWLNKTYGMDKIKQDIDHIVAKAKSDIECIDGQITDETLRKQVKAFYFKNINDPTVLSLSLQEGKKINETNQKITDMENKKTETAPMKIETEEEQKYIAVLNFKAYIKTHEQLNNLKKCLVENNIKFERI